MLVMGLMSGTSVDAIDVALCVFRPDPERASSLLLRLVGFCEQPFPPLLRSTLLTLFRQGSASLADLTALNAALGETFGEAARAGAETLGVPIDEVDLIASHGQTIYHLVEEERQATLQMGEPASIAAITGRTVTANFRTADMAVGGQGAPLVPYLDSLFFGDGRARAVQNIGGVGNVTFVQGREISAFDTGPGNALIDYGARSLLSERFDRDGAWAARGRVHSALLDEVLAHPYFSLPPPKTTGRELFGDMFAEGVIDRGRALGLSDADIMATLTAITVESIVRAYRDFGPEDLEEVIVAGGGARNGTLMDGLARGLGGIPVRLHEETGIPGDAKEAVAFALLGYETIHGRPANVPRCTGAARPAILGQIAAGNNFTALMRRAVEGMTWARTESLRLSD